MLYLGFIFSDLPEFNDNPEKSDFKHKFVTEIIQKSSKQYSSEGMANLFFDSKIDDNRSTRYANYIKYYRRDYQFFEDEEPSNISTLIFELKVEDAKEIIKSETLRIQIKNLKKDYGFKNLINTNPDFNGIEKEKFLAPKHRIIFSDVKAIKDFHAGVESDIEFTKLHSGKKSTLNNIPVKTYADYTKYDKYIRFEPYQTEYVDNFDPNSKIALIERIGNICLTHCIASIYNQKIIGFNKDISEQLENKLSAGDAIKPLSNEDETEINPEGKVKHIQNQLNLISKIVQFNVKYFSVNPVKRDNNELFLIYKLLTDNYPINELHEEQSNQLSFLTDLLIMESNRRIEKIRLEDQERKARDKENEKEKKQKDIEKTNLEEKHKSNRFNYIGAYVAIMSIMLAVFSPIIERMWQDLLDDKTNLKEVLLGFDLLTNSLLAFIFIVIFSSIALQRFIKSEDKKYQKELRLLDE